MIKTSPLLSPKRRGNAAAFPYKGKVMPAPQCSCAGMESVWNAGEHIMLPGSFSSLLHISDEGVFPVRCPDKTSCPGTAVGEG